MITSFFILKYIYTKPKELDLDFDFENNKFVIS